MLRTLTGFVTIPLWAYAALAVLFFCVGYAWGKNFWIKASEKAVVAPAPVPLAGRHRLREPETGEEEAMGCGELHIEVAYTKQAPHVSARILDWAGDDGDQVRTSNMGPGISFIIPETIMAGKGPLQFMENGPDALEHFVTGQNSVWLAGNGDVSSITDPDKVPTLEHIGFTGDGLSVSLQLVEEDLNNVVVNWGDGTEDNDEVLDHTYERPGLYLIRVGMPGQVDGNSEAYVYVDRFCVEQPQAT